MDQSEYNLTDICLAISKGDRDALSLLFKEYYNYLYNYGKKIIHNNDTIIKDCIQEVFMSIWIHRERLEQVKSIKPYLFSALRLTVYSHMERNKTRAVRDYRYLEISETDFLNIEELLILFEVEKEKETLVRESIQQLSARKKEAIFLRFYNGLSNDEIAEIMNINVQSVYNLISESILTLQKVFDRKSK